MDHSSCLSTVSLWRQKARCSRPLIRVTISRSRTVSQAGVADVSEAAIMAARPPFDSGVWSGFDAAARAQKM